MRHPDILKCMSPSANPLGHSGAPIRARLGALVRRAFNRAAAAVVAVASLLFPAACGHAETFRDSVSADIGRWQRYLAEHGSGDDQWRQVKTAVAPTLTRARDALEAGKVLLAYQRLAAARTYFAAYRFAEERSPQGGADSAGFERLWKASATDLSAELRPAAVKEFTALRPALLRALDEAARLQVRITRDARLEYVRRAGAGFSL